MNYDFKLTADGDLALGQQALDEEGYLLYYARRGEDAFEVVRDPEGNIPIRDLQDVYSEDAQIQLINSRLRTDNPDWLSYPEIGANLSDLIGEINTPQNAERGKNMILDSLTKDGAFSEEEVEVDVIPVGPEQLLFDVRLIRELRMIRFPVIFDFNVGIIESKEARL